MSDPRGRAPSKAPFPTTRWSRVVAAGDPAGPEARAALAELCAAYWYPIYAFIRRRGRPEEALDLTQEYFARLLERGPAAADPAGAGSAPSCWPTAASSSPTAATASGPQARRRRPRCRSTPATPRAATSASRRHGLTPERLFDRAWALALLDGVLDRLAPRVRRLRRRGPASTRSGRARPAAGRRRPTPRSPRRSA